VEVPVIRQSLIDAIIDLIVIDVDLDYRKAQLS
jgi:hypothetical protein